MTNKIAISPVSRSDVNDISMIICIYLYIYKIMKRPMAPMGKDAYHDVSFLHWKMVSQVFYIHQRCKSSSNSNSRCQGISERSI